MLGEIQVADGTMSLKQAGFQIAMSAAGSAIGVGADSLGGVLGVTSGVANAAIKSTTMAVGNTLLSGMTYSDEGGFNWQGSRMKNWKTWAGAGITAGAGALVAGFDLKGITGAGINTLGSGTSQGIVTGNWKESFQTAAINGAAGYLTGKLKFQSEVMQNASNMAFRNLFGSGEGFNWAVVAQTDPVGNFFTDLFSGKVVSPWTEQVLNEQNAARKQHQEDAMATLGFLDRLEMGIGGVFLSMKESLGNTMNNFVTGIGEDLAGFAGDMSALGAGISSVAGAVWEGISSAASSAWEGISFAASSAWDSLTSTASSVMSFFRGEEKSGEAAATQVSVTNDGTETMPKLGRKTNATTLIKNLAKEHKLDEAAMTDMMLTANGVGSVEELQKLLANGTPLKAIEGFGWIKGMQEKYYGGGNSSSVSQRRENGNSSNPQNATTGRTPVFVGNSDDIPDYVKEDMRKNGWRFADEEGIEAFNSDQNENGMEI